MRAGRSPAGRMTRRMLMAGLASALAGCTLPRSGPTAGEILAAGDLPEYGLRIITVTPGVAEAVNRRETLSFGPDLVSAGVVSPDTIRAGDTVAITVWENVDTGLLAGVGQKVTSVDSIQVDQAGDIFFPYVGRLRAAGRTPESLRNSITESLQSKTPDPQVEVRRVAGDGSTVSVLGGVARPGVYPIQAPTRRLSAMLAAAGGVTLVPDIAQVKIERGSRSSAVWLQDLYDNGGLDVALRAGDRIIVEEDRRAFTALGAAGRQSRVPFNKRELTALEAIAAAGGLDGRSADPTGVFVFRNEDATVVGPVMGRTDLKGPQRVAYILNLTEPQGLFAAREFVIRDEDTLYITEAPFASWSRVLSVATTTVSLAGSTAALAN